MPAAILARYAGAGGRVRGLLVAVEGVDGAGKTTLVARLAERLRARGREVVVTKEPTDGPHGRRIRASARTGRMPPEEELAAFLADRRDHVAEVLEPGVARGAIVLVDRYFYSTVAYQGARGLDPAELFARNGFAPVPDVCLWLDVPPELGVSRVRSRDGLENHFERLEDLRRCDAIFRGMSRPEIVRIDASCSTEDVAAVAESEILRAIGGGRSP